MDLDFLKIFADIFKLLSLGSTKNEQLGLVIIIFYYY